MKKMMVTMFASLFALAVNFLPGESYGQTKMDSSKMKDCSMMKDCCMMKGGKMMKMKDGKAVAMDHEMTMKNGTKCMVNGECIMKSGSITTMKEGQCMDMNGKMSQCSMMNKNMKSSKVKKSKDMAVSYTCPMHADVISDKPGNCPKCGMTLVKKKE